MHEIIDRKLSDLSVGQSASFETTVSENDLESFSNLVEDRAPVHFRSDWAQSMDYSEPIVFGCLIFSKFSGLLGMVLPGPRTVIHSSSFQMKKPVFVGDRLTYCAEILKVVNSVRVVILKLTVTRNETEIILEGETQCGFRS